MFQISCDNFWHTLQYKQRTESRGRRNAARGRHETDATWDPARISRHPLRCVCRIQVVRQTAV